MHLAEEKKKRHKPRESRRKEMITRIESRKHTHTKKKYTKRRSTKPKVEKDQ